MLTESDIKRLCREGESSRLDYKRDQYCLVGAKANDHEKSKCLKDILAFANAYRRKGESAYILIGVEEDLRHLGVVYGVDEVLDPNVFQQLVDSKTQQKIPFSVYALGVDGKMVQVIEIPSCVGRPPFYLTKNFGPLLANMVYFRTNTSTQVATPEEIWEWGRQSLESARPELEVGLVPITGILGDGLVHAFQIESDISPSSGTGPQIIGCTLPTFGASKWSVYKWFQTELGKIRFNVSIENGTAVQADNLKVSVEVLKSENDARLVEATDWDARPETRRLTVSRQKQKEPLHEITLCPGEKNDKIKVFHLSVASSGVVTLEVSVYGKNIKPIKKTFDVRIVRHDILLDSFYIDEMERNLDSLREQGRFFAHLLTAIKQSAETNSPIDWESAMHRYRNECEAKLMREMGEEELANSIEEWEAKRVLKK